MYSDVSLTFIVEKATQSIYCKVLGKSPLYTEFWVKFPGFWLLDFQDVSLRRTELNSDSELPSKKSLQWSFLY